MYNEVKKKDKPVEELQVDIALLELQVLRNLLRFSGVAINLEGVPGRESSVEILNANTSNHGYGRFYTLTYKIGVNWLEEVYNKGLAVIRYKQVPAIVLEATEIENEKLNKFQKLYKIVTPIITKGHREQTACYNSSVTWKRPTKVAHLGEIFAIAEVQSDGRFLVYCGTTVPRALSVMNREQKKRIKKMLGL